MDINYTKRVFAVQNTLDRIDELSLLNKGWFDGDQGEFLNITSVCNAKYLLTQLILDYPSLPTPYVYPTPEGGLQAEWTIKNTWALEVLFSHSGIISDFEATNIVTGEERKYEIGFAALHTISHNMQYFLSSLS